MHGPVNILVGITGSVAAVKCKELIDGLHERLPLLVPSIKDRQLQIKVVLTKNATYFTSILNETKSDGNEIPSKNPITILHDADEWDNSTGNYQRGDQVLHIELRKWASLFLIAPIDANTLAKMANGICDNLLTCILRCWDPKKPLLVAPAMNTMMWEHPVTLQHLKTIQSWGFDLTVIQPVLKLLACGDYGIGAMESVEEILKAIGTKISNNYLI